MSEAFTATEKLKAVRREIGWRRRVYPDRVRTGHMSQHEADRQIAIFEEIANDYDQLAQKERLL